MKKKADRQRQVAGIAARLGARNVLSGPRRKKRNTETRAAAMPAFRYSERRPDHGLRKGRYDMEERGSTQQAAYMEKGALEGGMNMGASHVAQIECSPNRFQLLKDMDVREKETGGSRSSCRASLDGLPNGGLRSEGQNSEMDKVSRMDGDIGDTQQQAQGPRAKSPTFQIPSRSSSRGEDGQGLGLAEESPNQSIAGMLRALSLEVRGGFETLNTNQEIRGFCETLGEKIDDLAGRTTALEEELGDLKTAMETNKA
ncbi:hypothetical protein NDU88_006275 [Pleurodeles waltl]|uniref:Uncharacterized protein n=1 Tax=Pleurodeles waltl TaxID=8319 RepID=A0AAV7PKD6_PLEWA|nr:hypothetical protein NDU88_006275 [Pleurodeles waltl]